MENPAIHFQGVGKSFDRFRALDDVTASVGRGEVIVLCGPSGSGKSTLIRTINRLSPVTEGTVTVEGIDVYDRATDIIKLRQRIGFVFQHYNLFPHMTATDNVAIGLRKLQGVPAREARERARELLARVGLGHRADNTPARLSGGEQQRVAIVRAMSMNPSILLLDEPTSALDPVMASEVKSLIGSLREQGITMMCVTHEMGFARQVADHVWFMEKGKIVENRPSREFFAGATNERARRFLDALNTDLRDRSDGATAR